MNNFVYIFKEKFLPRLSDLIVEIELTAKFFREYDIKGVILPWDQVGLYKIFALVGKKLNLETFRYQDGVLGEYKFYILPSSEKILVWGKTGKEYYLSRGIDKKRIITIGYPAMDNLKKWIKYPKKENIRKVILFAGTSFEGATSFDYPQFQYLLLETICQTARKMPDLQFIIKLHGPPQNTPQAKEIIAKAATGNIILFDKYNFYKLLSIADILVAPASTVILEALLMKIPPIILEPDIETAILNPYRKWPGIFYAKNASDLEVKIEKILKEKNASSQSFKKAKQFLEDYIGEILHLGGGLPLTHREF